MALPFVARVATGVTPTSAGTQSFTAPGFGTCVGYIVFLTLADTLDTYTNGAATSWGCGDGTRERVVYGYSRDNVTTSFAQGGGEVTGESIRLLDPADASTLVLADFDAFVTDGVSLDFTTVDSTAYLVTVVLVFGEDAETYAWDAEGIGTTTITPGFRTDVIIGQFARNLSGGLNPEFHHQEFFASRVNPTDGMTMTGVASDHNRGTSETERLKFTGDRVTNSFRIASGANTEYARARIDTYTSTTFAHVGTLINLGGPGAAHTIGLAIHIGDSIDWDLAEDDGTPASSGVEAKTPGFQTAFIAMNGGHVFEANNRRTQAAGGFGVSDFNIERFHFTTDQNNQSTTNATSYVADVAWFGANDGGSGTLGEAEGAVTSGGYELDWDAVPGTSRLFGILAIEMPTWSADFDVTLPALTATATVAVEFRADFSVTLPALVASLTVEADARVSFAVDLPALVTSAAVAIEYRADFDVALPALVAAATAELGYVSTFAVDLPPLVASAAVAIEYRASFAVTLPALSVLVTAEISLTATFAVDLPVLVASAAVAIEYRATFAVALPTLVASAAAELQYAADFAVALPSVTASASAELTFEADFAVDLPALVASATVETDATVSFSVTLPALVASAAATLEYRATFAVALPALDTLFVVSSISGFQATFDVTLPALVASLTVETDARVSFSVTLPALVASATAAIEYRADFAVALPVLIASATVASEYRADFDVALPVLVASATANLEYSADFTVVLPALVPAFVATTSLAFDASFAVALPALQVLDWQLFIPIVGTRTELRGSYDLRSALTGSYVLRAAHAGEYCLRTALAGEEARRTALPGNDTTRTAFAGEL